MRGSTDIGNTPLRFVKVVFEGSAYVIGLKLEGENPFGSIKDRTALSLLNDAEANGRIRPGGTIIESSSGNLAVALAAIGRERGYRMVAVVDPRIPEPIETRLLNLGARLEVVDIPDASGAFLLARLARVRELCEGDASLCWTDQYGNLANPRAHFLGTAPELQEQMKDGTDAVFVPVSTGGTLAGISQFFRHRNPTTRIVAVDTIGSIALGGAPAPRTLRGIGSARRSEFVTPNTYDHAFHIGAATAVACGRAVTACTGIVLGESGAAAVASAIEFASVHPDLTRLVCICPDYGSNYEHFRRAG